MFCHNVVAEIGFELSFYNVTEGSDVEICITSSENVHTSIFANITFVAGLAESKFFVRNVISNPFACRWG